MQKFTFIRYFLFLLLCLIQLFFNFAACSEEYQDDELVFGQGTPLIDASILPGYFLSYCEYCIFPVKDGRNNKKTINRDFVLERDFEKTKKVKEVRESWSNISHENYLKEEKILGEGKVPCWGISVIRYHLDSPNDAKIFSTAYVNRFQSLFTEGPYTGTVLGEKCWNNGNVADTKRQEKAFGYKNGLHIIFLRGSTVLRVDGWGLPWRNNTNPMPPKFVEDIARAINKKLK